VVIVTKIFTLLLLISPLLADDFVYFTPPKGWELANPETLSMRVKAAFLGKSNRGFPPSINLALEETDASLPVYMEAVKKIYQADPNSKWRDLGRFNTAFGEGRLSELETKAELGVARIVQLIVIKNKTAYILTTSALKDEFSKYYKAFDEAFASFTMTNDLANGLKAPEKKARFQQLMQNLTPESFETFQKTIINDFTEIGPYWQILVIQEAYNHLQEKGK